MLLTMKAHKRKNNGKSVWEVRLPKGKDEYGIIKYFSIYGSTSKEAIEKAEAKKYNLVNDVSETQPVVSNNHYTLDHAYDELHKDWQVAIAEKAKNPKRGLDKSTINGYDSSTNRLFKLVSRQTRLVEINKAWVRNFIRDLKTKQWSANKDKVLSDKQANTAWQMFNKLMDSAVKSDLVEVSVHKIFQSEAPTYEPVGKKAIDEVTMKEISRHFIDVANNGFVKESQAAMISLLEMYSGIRWGEAAGLPYENINWNTGETLISQSKDSKDGRIKMTKSGTLRTANADKGERVVTFSKKILLQIPIVIADLHTHKTSGLIFDVAYKTTNELVQGTGKKLSIKLETKDFRRFYATQLAKLGASRDERQQALGHATVDMQDTYITHDNPEAPKRAEEIFNILN